MQPQPLLLLLLFLGRFQKKKENNLDHQGNNTTFSHIQNVRAVLNRAHAADLVRCVCRYCCCCRLSLQWQPSFDRRNTLFPVFANQKFKQHTYIVCIIRSDEISSLARVFWWWRKWAERSWGSPSSLGRCLLLHEWHSSRREKLSVHCIWTETTSLAVAGVQITYYVQGDRQSRNSDDDGRLTPARIFLYPLFFCSRFFFSFSS